MSGFGIASEKVPTMKSQGAAKNEANNAAQETKPVEKIDFSKVKVEPLFEEMVDFDTFSKSDLLNVSKSTSSLNNGSISTLEKSITSFLASGAFAAGLDAFLSVPSDFIVGTFSDAIPKPLIFLSNSLLCFFQSDKKPCLPLKLITFRISSCII